MVKENRNKIDFLEKADMVDELVSYKARLKIALKVAKICVFEVDLTRQLYTFFENAEDIFGVSGEKILEDVKCFQRLCPNEYQKAASDYFSHPDDQEVIDHAFQSIFRGEPTTYQARMRAGETEFIWCKIDVSPIMKNGVPVKMIGVITDISESKRKTETLQKAATLDLFTGLYNKKHIEHEINTLLKEDPNANHAMVVFDLDDFKRINDTYGHVEGDKVIQSVATKLKKHLNKTNICGRFGGDEFVILLKDIPYAEFLTFELEKLLLNNDNAYGVTKSIGVSIFPQHGTNFADLFYKADAALYESKRKKNCFTIA